MRSLTASTALKITAAIGALAVALGAFGAHGLEDLLTRTGRVETWKTAALYHLLHSVVLLVLLHLPKWRPLSWMLFAAGITVFSGSLYLLCLTDTGWLGAVTPIGGLLFIAGWGSLAISRKR